jgi:hypothetical protein
LCGLPKGCIGVRLHHRYTSSWCGFFGSHPKPTSAISAGSGIPEAIVITVHVRDASCGAKVVEPSYSTTLEVGYIGFIINARAGA